MQKLIDIYESLDEHGQHALIAFAQFLQTSDGQAVDVGDLSVNRKPAKPAPVQIPQPKDIPRPDAETVIVALKRLSSTYHMLDKRQLFDASSDLVSQSMMDEGA